MKRNSLQWKWVLDSLMNAFVLEENVIRSLLAADDEQPSWVFILNISHWHHPWQLLASSYHPEFPTRWGESSLLTRRGGLMLTPTAAVHSTPSLLFFCLNSQQPLVKTLAIARCKPHGPSRTLHFSRRSWLSRARLSLPAPSWVTCFLSSTISLMRLFHKEKNKIKCQGVWSKWFLCSEAQGQTAGTDEFLDQRRSCWDHSPHVSLLFPCHDPPLQLWKRSPMQILELISRKSHRIFNIWLFFRARRLSYRYSCISHYYLT